MTDRMKLRLLVLAVTAAIGIGAALPVAASTTVREPAPIVREYQPEQILTKDNSSEPIIWAVVGIAGASLIGGVLYLLKREVGGFPASPDWVAPISIVRSQDAAVEPEDYAEPPADEHH